MEKRAGHISNGCILLDDATAVIIIINTNKMIVIIWSSLVACSLSLSLSMSKEHARRCVFCREASEVRSNPRSPGK